MSPERSLARWRPTTASVPMHQVKVWHGEDDGFDVQFGNNILWVSSHQHWLDFVEAVELGFTNLTHRPVPLRTDGVKPSGSAA